MPSRVLRAREEHGSKASDSSASNPTIAPYHSGLNGVNQPVNFLLTDVLWWSLGIVALALLVIRIGEVLWKKARHLSAMSMRGEQQNYWKNAQWSWMPWLKAHVIYAPLWRKRHYREFRLSAAINMGILPSRLHTTLLALYMGSNLVYMFILNWQNENRYAFCAELRGRSGTLAAVNMVPLVILAGRNNPLIPLLQVSFDTYNLLHRWMGRVVVFEVLIHTLAWTIVQVADGGWESVWMRSLHDRFIAVGVVGMIALAIIFVISASPIRHAFYETFLNAHIILAFVIFLLSYLHCIYAEIPGGLPQAPWFGAIAALWIIERLWRIKRLVWNSCSRRRGQAKAVIEAMPGEATRVTVHLPRHVDIPPGSHAYLRFTAISPWESHPFSCAWVEHVAEKHALPMTEEWESKAEATKIVGTKVSFLIGAHTGFTRKLYERARRDGLRSVTLNGAYLEGPYGGHHSLDSYGHVLLFAGATGITHQLGYVRHLVRGHAEGTVAARRVVLIWIVRDLEAMEWVRPWMDEVLRMPRRKEVLQVRIFITRPKNAREIRSPSQTLQMSPGRPNIPLLVRREVNEHQVGAMAVSVCGGGAMQDEVAKVVREVQEETPGVKTLYQETFSW